jgi:hypothetical protein
MVEGRRCIETIVFTEMSEIPRVFILGTSFHGPTTNEHVAHAHYSNCIERTYKLNVRQIVMQSFYYMFVSTFLMNMVFGAEIFFLKKG